MAEGGGNGKAGGGAPPVFISYASQDAAVASALVEALERHGIACWIAPRDVSPGEFYADAIVRALNEARMLMLVLTESAINSPHVLREVERTSAKRHPIVSVRLTSVSLPPALEYFLSASHWLDASASGIDSAIPKLVEAVRRLVAPPCSGERGQAGDTARPMADLIPPPPVATKLTQRRGRLLVALSTVIALIAAYLIVDKFWLSRRTAAQQQTTTASPAVSDRSIAVLPFVDMSEKHDQEYFGDGLAEQILNELARIPELKVIGRTSSFRFKGNADDLRDVGKTLGARYMLEGSVRRSGDQIRVTAQLVDARDGSHRWSQTYDRSSVDALQLQEEIATAIARVLQVSITDYYGQSHIPRSPEAYDFYLRAVRDLDTETPETVRRALTEFGRAIKLDDEFVAAMVGEAMTYDVAGTSGYMPANEAFPRAKEIIERALVIDPRNADAYVTRALIRINFDFDWDGATLDLRKAREFGGAHDAYLGEAKLAAARGDLAHAAEVLEAQLATSPLEADCYDLLGAFIYPALGRFDEADAAERRFQEVNPNYKNGVAYFAGVSRLLRGRIDEAAAQIDAEPNEAAREILRALVTHAQGRPRESDAALKRAISVPNPWLYDLARAYAYRGDKDEALVWLEKSAALHDTDLWKVTTDPMLKNLAGDEGFHAFLRKMKLPG